MRTAVVRPYVAPPAYLVSCGAWRVGDSPEETLGERITTWDYATELRLRRGVTVATESLAAGATLPAGVPLALIASWFASGTRRREVGAVHYLQPGCELESLELDIVVPAGEASGVLEVVTRVVLAETLDLATPITAFRAGSELWVDTARVELEGGAAMFPIETRSFATDTAFPRDAAWMVQVTLDDLESTLSSNVRVLLNTDVPQSLLALRVGDASDRGDVVRQALRLDIARALLTRALRDGVLEQSPNDFEPGSMGRLLLDLLSLLLDGVPAAEARSLLEHDPGEFDARLQSALHFLGESA